MSTKVYNISISFPCEVELTDEMQHELVQIADKICNAYEAKNPSRVMWPFGIGSRILSMPMTKEEEDAGAKIEFDDATFAVDCSERERYHDFSKKTNQCKHCGKLDDGTPEIRYDNCPGVKQ